jgi:hypothetical protein
MRLTADLIPKSFRSSRNVFEANWGSRSEMILSGSPDLLYRLSSSLAVPSAVIVLLQGMRITPLLRAWSTTTKIESKPFTRGKSVMKSIEQYAKGQVDLAPSVGINASLEGCLLILNC